MVRRTGGFSSPGTRVSKSQTEKSEYRPYIIQAIAGAISVDVVLLGLAVILLTIGWPVLFVVSLLIAYFGTLAVIKIVEYTFGVTLTYQESMRLAWAFVISIAISDYFFIAGWWDSLVCKEIVALLIAETLSPFKLPSWIYFSLIGVWFFGALKKVGKITLIAITACLLLWTIYNVDYGNINFDILWSRARYLVAVFVVPWILFGFIFAVSMTKELIAPNLNFILETIPWSDYKQAGGIYGLLFPELIEWKEQISNRVSYNIAVMGRKNSHGKPTSQKRRTLFAPTSDAQGLAKYAQAIFDGRATFSEKGTRDGRMKGATHFGYTQPEYKMLREAMCQLELLDKKGNNYTLNDDGKEALHQVINRVMTPLP